MGDADFARRNSDKANIYLPYVRELGAIVILAMVLYGVWDIIKVEGQLGISAINNNTKAVESLVAVQDKLLVQLRRLEEAHNASVQRNMSTTASAAHP